MYFNNFIVKIKLPFRKDKELYRRLYSILGFYPNNISYYKQALMHKSLSAKTKDGRRQNNERLEFLGDAILDAIVGDIVYRHFAGKGEGFLTNTRSKLVQRETLGKLAVEMGLDKLIQSNHSRQQSHNSYMAGNAFEALVGAIYLDYGYQQCMKFMEKRILGSLVDIDKMAYKEVNFKSKLLEWSQKNRIRMEFKDLEKRSEKDGSSVFHTIVVIEGLDCGRGQGYSKKESQQNAARESLLMLKTEKGMEEKVFEAKSKRTAMEEQPEALLPDIPEDILTKPVPKDKAEKPTEKKADKPAEKKADKPTEKKADKPAEKKTDKPAEKKAEKPAEKKADKPTEKKTDKPAEKKADKPVEKKADTPKGSDSDKPTEKKADRPTEKKANKPTEKKADKPSEEKKPRRNKPSKAAPAISVEEADLEDISFEASLKPSSIPSNQEPLTMDEVAEQGELPSATKPSHKAPAQATPETPAETPTETAAEPSAEAPSRKKTHRGHRRSAKAFGDAAKKAEAATPASTASES